MLDFEATLTVCLAKPTFVLSEAEAMEHSQPFSYTTNITAS